MQRTSGISGYYNDENMNEQENYERQGDQSLRQVTRAAPRADHRAWEACAQAYGASPHDEWESRPVVGQGTSPDRRT